MKTKLTSDKRILDNFERRLDRHAIHQLREEINRLSKRVEELQNDFYMAEQRAYDGEPWLDIAIDLVSEAEQQIGLTQEGEFGIISKEH